VLTSQSKESLKFFAEVPKITESCDRLEEVGLAICGWGSQLRRFRVARRNGLKLAAHLHPRAGDWTGRLGRCCQAETAATLHLRRAPRATFDDVSKTPGAFRRLNRSRGSIVVIEHNLEVIKTRGLGNRPWARRWQSRGQDCGRGHTRDYAKLPGSYTGKVSGAYPERQWHFAIHGRS